VITVTADGRGVASHAGSRLLADLAGVTGLAEVFSEALGGLRQRRSRHDPGRVLVDVAVMLADGGEAISDLAVLRDQPDLFGPVASTATAWRVLDSIDQALLDRMQQARAMARERAWMARTELGRELPAATAGGRVLPGLVIDFDASLVPCHSEKESAAATFKGGDRTSRLWTCAALTWLAAIRETRARCRSRVGSVASAFFGFVVVPDQVSLTNQWEEELWKS
jgi:hypothetical protein